MKIAIQIVGKSGKVYAEKCAELALNIEYNGKYRIGTVISIETDSAPCYLMIKLDDAMNEIFVYIKNKKWQFHVPYFFGKIPYPPEAFKGKTHRISVRVATQEEIGKEKNVCLNPYDTNDNNDCYPHAHANVETRNSAMFLARNAINGNTENHGHGKWPYESWGINKDPNAELTVEFGRSVVINKIILVTRADFPHDSWWENAEVSYSDGSTLQLQMKKSDEPHIFNIEPKRTEWIKLGKLIKTKEDSSEFPALTQIEAYGYEDIK